MKWLLRKSPYILIQALLPFAMMPVLGFQIYLLSFPKHNSMYTSSIAMHKSMGTIRIRCRSKYMHVKPDSSSALNFIHRIHDDFDHDGFNSSNDDNKNSRRNKDDEIFSTTKIFQHYLQNNDHKSCTFNNNQLNRRVFFASAMFGAGMAIAPRNSNAVLDDSDLLLAASTSNGSSKLQYKTSPVNKRSGITVFDAEEKGYYNVKFVTYLSRFLINFDEDCQRWWYARAADIPRDSTIEKVNKKRLQQFGAFSASVEVGLQEYEGSDGPCRLLESMLKRYCPTTKEELETINKGRNLSSQALEKQQKEINEARRQIALLFGLLDNSYQPVEQLTKLLAAIDNGSIEFIVVKDGGEGYAPGYGPPYVVFPDPEAGVSEGFRRATGRAKLGPNGRLLRIDMNNRGGGYKRTPTVTISPPQSGIGKAATAQAILFNDGINKGSIERISLQDGGLGYDSNEIITVTITPPETLTGIQATASAVRELKVVGVEITDGGSGYATERALSVFVDPPPLTARINLNDPMYASSYPSTVALPKYVQRNKAGSMEELNSASDKARIFKAANNDGKGGAGKCVGRACYDKLVNVIAFARSEYDTYQSLWDSDDFAKISDIEQQLERRAIASRSVAGATTGYDYSSKRNIEVFGKSASSSDLLNLLPSGYGLEFNEKTRKYNWALAQNFEEMSSDWMQGSAASSKMLDPDLGPRGRSPIEKMKEYDLNTALRFMASGAICCSTAHLLLTPIDVVKTRMQTNPQKYPGIIDSFKKVLEEEGSLSGFFRGWIPTYLGYFTWGAAGYTLVEIVRRYLSDYVGPEVATTFEVPIIVLAASVSAIVGSFLICPFEAVRIRSVSQPDYADSSLACLSRMVKDEGVSALFAAFPAFLLKEVPFAIAKFTVFDLTSETLYEKFPVAQEDIRLSLYISLVSGTLGGIVAAIVSNPADSTISEMKKAKSELGPIETAKMLLDRGGIGAWFTGLQLRMFFYSLMVSIQFFLYDSVKLLLGIGSDDLKLYLDVLGGALTEGGGPI